MSQKLLFALALLTAVGTTGYAQQKGQQYHVPEWEWVYIEGRPVSNGNDSFDLGDSCGIKAGGTVTVKGLSKDGQRALVQYATDGTQYGTPCPSGAIFFLTVKELSTFEQRYKAVSTTQVSDIKEVDDLLDGKTISAANGVSVGQKLPVPGWQWTPIAHKGGTPVGELEPICGIEAGATVTVRAINTSGTKALVDYHTNTYRRGTPCKDGMKLVISIADLSKFSGRSKAELEERQNRIKEVQQILGGSVR